MAPFFRFSYRNIGGKEIKHSAFVLNRSHLNDILDRYNLSLGDCFNLTINGEVVLHSQVQKIIKN